MPRVALICVAWAAALSSACTANDPLRPDRYGDALPKHAVARLGTVRLLPESGTANGLEFSPDGKLLASVSSGRFGAVPEGIQIWSTATGREAAPLPIRDRDVNGAAWSPDSRRLVTCHSSGGLYDYVQIWNIETARLERTLAQSIPRFYCVAWSPDGRFIAAGQKEGTLQVWSADSGRMLRDFGVPAISVRFSRDGKWLAAGNKESLRVWQVEDWSELRKVAGEWGECSIRPCLSPDGTHAAYCGDEGLRFVNLKTGEWSEAVDGTDRVPRTGVSKQPQPEGLATFDLAFSPDGKLLAGTGFDKKVHVWDVSERREVRQFPIPLEGFAVSFSPDGKTLAFMQRRIVLLDLESGLDRTAPETHSENLISACFSRDGSTIISRGLSDSGTIRWWDWKTSKQLRVVRPGFGGPMALSHDGRTLATVGVTSGEIWLLDSATGDEKARFQGPSEPTISLDFSPDGETLASIDMNGTVTLWDTAAQRKRIEIAPPTPDDELGSGLCAVRFSPDGKLLARTRRDAIDLLDPATGAEKRQIDAEGTGFFLPVAFSPDGSTLVGVTTFMDPQKRKRFRAQWWDVGTGRVIGRAAPLNYFVTALACSPDGTLVAGADSAEPYTVSLWSRSSGKRLLELTGHLDNVRDLAFSSDGQHLLSASQDSTVLVWDVSSVAAKQKSGGR